MTTAYQISSSIMMVKDLFFGWVMIRNEVELYIMADMDEQALHTLLENIPTTVTYEEIRKHIQKLLMERALEAAKQKAVQHIENKRQTLYDQQQAAIKARQEQAITERHSSIVKLAESADMWFQNCTPLTAFELKNEVGYVYARIVPGVHEYVLMTKNHEVVCRQEKLIDIAKFVANRWW